jgi:predicted 2-oxoglutarate/Fe(II)-dependent dioxygenase YbiX
MIADSGLLQQINAHIWRRVRPEVEKAFQFRITHFERYLVACYDGQSQGFFKAHRDNTNVGMVHRRFAMTLNLNEGYGGGYLRFPEYGTDLYRSEPGGAVLFSCSLLHEVTPVTHGTRFALLSFFYGEREAQFRAQTLQQIAREGGSKTEFTAGNLPIAPS